MQYSKLSKILSHALRHSPEEYGLTLDENGWADLNVLLRSIREKVKEFEAITQDDIRVAVEHSSKKRHEILDMRIRAFYGHSLEARLTYKEALPPEYLFHGTGLSKVSLIKKEGLKRMERNYVHLSEKREDALIVGKRKDTDVYIFKIEARRASLSGVKFYSAENNVWLADYIPPSFLCSE